MYTSGQNVFRVGYESIGWRDGSRDCCAIRQRANSPCGSDDVIRFLQRPSCSGEPSTLPEIFYGVRIARIIRGRRLGHRVRKGSDAAAGVVESIDAGFQRVVGFPLYSRAFDVSVHAVPTARERSESGTIEGHAGGNADFHNSNLRNPRGAGGLVALFLQQAIDEGPIP